MVRPLRHTTEEDLVGRRDRGDAERPGRREGRGEGRGGPVVAVPVEAAEKAEAEYRSSGRGWTNASTARTRDWTGPKSAWTDSRRVAKAVEPGSLIRGRPLSWSEEG